MDKKDLIEAVKNIGIRQCRAKMRLGGAVALKSYLAITNRQLLDKIVGTTAEVKVGYYNDGSIYLYIALPLSDGTFKELKVTGDLEELDIVNISSIVAVFMDTPKGNTIVRYTGICMEKETDAVSSEDIQKMIVESYQASLREWELGNKLPALKKLSTNVPDSFKKAVEKSIYKKEKKTTSNRFWQYELECELNQRKEYSDEEIWYGMTDGMYGDYPDEGFDNDYESMGY
jgi:hypothetical protein